MNSLQRILHRPFFIKLLNWEYWSFNSVYLLIYPVWILLCLRARSFFFFAASNPSIKNGGFLCESKKDIIAIIPPQYHPPTAFFSIPANGDMVVRDLKRAGLQFPLIGKPNIGGRGRGVKVLRDEADVRNYARTAYLDFHIQEFVPWKNEAGIFYVRYPGEEKGRITGIVGKQFLSVTGDGKHTLLQLLQKDKRALMYLPSLQKIHGERMNLVLPPGEKMIVSPFGNHARGSKFLDESHLADEALTNVMDSICKMIPEFYFGRLDIRYDTWEAMKQGKNFSIIEVNGAGAEPTHIYDPAHSIFFAWKEIVRHWIILYRISRMNHKKGHRYLSWREGIAMFREDREWSRKLAAMTE
ncbi:hypothetical protein [Longitalea arenae]|uniref:hypothetical protein n=1 Tax=Longitalea arenae TaxID=2812558 RepID=UPI00196812F9|nr:hypothetical protein [Longitalea arenae]